MEKQRDIKYFKSHLFGAQSCCPFKDKEKQTCVNHLQLERPRAEQGAKSVGRHCHPVATVVHCRPPPEVQWQPSSKGKEGSWPLGNGKFNKA